MIDWDIALPAPAKLNLFLHVVGRRHDGYHLLQTVFRLIDRSDVLRFERRSDNAIRLAAPLPGVPEDSDLVVRAARLLQAESGARAGATIHVEKHIPMGGGLGGGSSDAATTLIALNSLWRLGLSRGRLAEIGLRLGADVPVFVRGHNAFAEGVGEILTPVRLAPAWYVVLTPQVAVPTKEVFADPALTRTTVRTTITAFFAGQQGDGGETGNAGAMPGFRNDLEPVVTRRYPDVLRCLEWLARFGLARMSGSGSSVFLECASEQDAGAVFAQASADRGEGLPATVGFVAQGLEQHPLAEDGVGL